jgi:hypothetical protein
VVHASRSPGQGNLEASAPPSLACPFSFASTSSSTSIRASSPRPHRNPRRSPTSERDQRHVVPTSAAHILSLSKTSSAHASRVTTGFTTPSFRPFHSPMECPVSRRAHPASAGLPAVAVERCLLAPHPENRTSDAPSLPRPPRPLQILPPAPSSSLPPHLRVDVRFVPSQDAFHRQALPRGSAPAPESRVVDSNDEHRALFTHDFRRGLDALDSMTHPHHRASFVKARLPASAVCHDPRPLPRFQAALAIPWDGRAERASEEAVRAGRRPSEDASFYPAVPRRTMSSEHPSSPARSAMMMGNTITPTSLGSRPPLRSTHPSFHR